MIGAVGLIARGDRAVQARTLVAPGAGFDIVVPVELSRIRRQLTIRVIEPSRARTCPDAWSDWRRRDFSPSSIPGRSYLWE
ncbi:MAG: hypothetical protein ACRDQ6_00645 [Pseudonocardiaceae bacterium]